jgi:hypothetical protein
MWAIRKMLDARQAPAYDDDKGVEVEIGRADIKFAGKASLLIGAELVLSLGR